MKKSIFCSALMVLALIAGCSGAAPTAKEDTDHPAAVILNNYSTRDFLAGDILEADLDIMIQAGIRAPSARNLQPWHFTVIQNQELAREIISNNLEGNILIVVSAQGDGKTNGVQILDCALAVENIYLAAQALGYGSRIYTGPMGTVNSQLKAQLDLPSDYNAVALVRIGKIAPDTDAVSSASSRKSAEEIVTYKR